MHKQLTTGIFCTLLCLSTAVQAQQTTPKFTVNGAARSIYFADVLEQELAEPDTVTPPRQNSGHALADIGVNIRPSEDLEIQGMVRIRNDFGGFWGAGVTFDIRQLYLKGVLNKVVRYQLGDINYQLTKYTLYNNDQELYDLSPVLLAHLSDQVMYDNFQNLDHSWRQQGAAVDFGFNFRSVIESADMHLFTSRVMPSNFATVSDRLFSSASIEWVQGAYLSGAFTYASLYDLKGTSRNDILLQNPVYTASLSSEKSFGNWTLSGDLEAGMSQTRYLEDPLAPERSDVFSDLMFQLQDAGGKLSISAGYKWVGPDFRSPGAQTKRVLFDAYPAAFDRLTNNQLVRSLTMLDLIRESSLYNLQLSEGLMVYDPRYDNITPYGAATPNRQGLQANATCKLLDDRLSANLNGLMLTEVRGQGTTSYRQFNRLEARLNWEQESYSKNKTRALKASVSLRMDNTSRPADQEGVPSVDLSTMIAGTGLEIEILEKTDLVAGLLYHSYSGFEFMNQTDAYGDIVNFNEFNADGSQWMGGAGIRYRFSDQVYVMGQYNNFGTSNVIGTLPAYGVSQLALLFSMEF
ncbi:MAG: hypothetical protein H6548_03205 [Chitinophagales bacterium]|nr:hypothetical protein [Chitinophagales bacterium]HAE12909.1 hypothetical protein [Bacteroidota bacterium]MCB9021103.1 hypothetical protein [Chitinophagales bacterium]HAE34618.1 hypothetical protein [Bacteroidota bacterium]HPE96479.1 hypothetical protein [Chitinophagales bacterium]